jgi:hypothetical protein
MTRSRTRSLCGACGRRATVVGPRRHDATTAPSEVPRGLETHGHSRARGGAGLRRMPRGTRRRAGDPRRAPSLRPVQTMWAAGTSIQTARWMVAAVAVSVPVLVGVPVLVAVLTAGWGRMSTMSCDVARRQEQRRRPCCRRHPSRQHTAQRVRACQSTPLDFRRLLVTGPRWRARGRACRARTLVTQVACTRRNLVRSLALQ